MVIVIAGELELAKHCLNRALLNQPHARMAGGESVREFSVYGFREAKLRAETAKRRESYRLEDSLGLACGLSQTHSSRAADTPPTPGVLASPTPTHNHHPSC